MIQSGYIIQLFTLTIHECSHPQLVSGLKFQATEIMIPKMQWRCDDRNPQKPWFDGGQKLGDFQPKVVSVQLQVAS